MSTDRRPKAPTTDEELAALLFSPGKGHVTIPQVMPTKAAEGVDEALARLIVFGEHPGGDDGDA